MARKNRVHPLLVAGGVVVIVLALLIFTPFILGATASGNDLEKYNGSSQQGNDTARISHEMNSFFVGLTGIPLVLAAFVSALFVVVIAVMWVLKKNR